MKNMFSRTKLLIGEDNLKTLSNSKVAIFGIGGVGSYVAESLARVGIGKFVLVDSDTICITNINRQIHATHKTVGLVKVEVMKQRILDINPDADVIIHHKYIDSTNLDEYISNDYDYIVDAIDSVKSKIELIVKAKENNIPIISSMGAGNKLDPTKFKVCDISKTSVCPLARIVRKELKKRHITKLKTVFSDEIPINLNQDNQKISSNNEMIQNKSKVPGSISFIPSAVGLIIASEVVKDLTKNST